jgi:hypothetical protein
MKYLLLASTFAALTFASISPVIADEQTRLIQNGNLFPITNRLSIAQFTLGSFNESGTSNFLFAI